MIHHHKRPLACTLVLLACHVADSQANPINGGFETPNEFGWTTTNRITGLADTVNGFGGIAGHVHAVEGGAFVIFNFDGFNADDIFSAPLSQNLISQSFVVSGTALSFIWNHARLDYTGNGGVTFQVRYQDVTSATPVVIHDVHHAPNGTTPRNDIHPWIAETITGLIPGHLYDFEFRGGFSEGMPTGFDNGELYYMLDDVRVVPEPTNLTLLATALLTLFGFAQCGNRTIPRLHIAARTSGLHILFFLALFSTTTTATAAPQSAINILGGSPSRWAQSPGTMSGWQFSTDHTLQAVQLGYYDWFGVGLEADHQVAIWDVDGNLLVTETVSAGTVHPRIGGFRYVDIPPTPLPPGTYVVGGHTTGGIDELVTSFLDFPNPWINYEGERTEGFTEFTFPTGFTPRDPNYGGIFGPSFRFELVPEPSAIALVALAGATLLAFRYRRRPAANTRDESTHTCLAPTSSPTAKTTRPDPSETHPRMPPHDASKTRPNSAYRALISLAILWGAGAHTALASSVAVQISGGHTFFWGQFPGTMSGWKFSTTAPLAITKLGYYDHDGGGLTGSHQVGIWEIHGDLIVENTVAAGTTHPLTDGFRYVDVAPTLIQPGTYVIGGHTTGGIDHLIDDVEIITHPHVIVEQVRYEQFANFKIPTLRDDRLGIFGPNFQFDVVPEPSTLALAALFAVTLVAFRPRKRPRSTT